MKQREYMFKNLRQMYMEHYLQKIFSFFFHNRHFLSIHINFLRQLSSFCCTSRCIFVYLFPDYIQLSFNLRNQIKPF